MIDLHTHSIFSDGTDTPEDMALMANIAGLKALALTDHDTVDGISRFMAMQASVTTVLIPGIELSCRFMGNTLHIVGLFLDFKDVRLINYTKLVQLQRLERNKLIVGRLKTIGISITWEDVLAEAPTDLVSRVHIARALVSCGVVGSSNDAFHRLIGDGGPCFIPSLMHEPSDVVQLIRDVGGVAVVAHPGRGFTKGFLWDSAMLKLKRIGIQGLEAYYPAYGPVEHDYFLRLAIDLDLIPCGGSDYHGSHKPKIFLGIGSGDLHVPDSVLEMLQDARRSRKSSN